MRLRVSRRARRVGKACLLVLASVALGACDTFRVSSETGETLVVGRRGGCVVGCNIHLRESDGTPCDRSFTTGISEGVPFVTSINCASVSGMLRVEAWRSGQTSAGTLDGMPVTIEMH